MWNAWECKNEERELVYEITGSLSSARGGVFFGHSGANRTDAGKRRVASSSRRVPGSFVESTATTIRSAPAFRALRIARRNTGSDPTRGEVTSSCLSLQKAAERMTVRGEASPSFASS